MVSWRDTAGENNSVRDRVLSTLSPAQLAARGGLGSTRGSTPGSTDSHGMVIPVPGRRPRGARNTTNVATQQQQQPQPVTSAGSSIAASQQQHQPAAKVGFSGTDSYQNRPAASSYAGPSPQATFPITGGQRHHNATPPQSWSSVSNGVNGYIQYVGDPESNRGPPSNGYNQPNNPYAGFVSGKYVKRGTSPVGASPVDHYIPSVPHPSSTGGSDGDVEDEWSGEDDGSEDVYDTEESHDSLESYDREDDFGSEESHDSYDSDDCEDDDNGDGDDGHDGNDGSDEHDQTPKDDENDVEMFSAQVDHGDYRETAQERWKWERYLERDRIQVYSYLDGQITREELLLDIDQNRAQLKASLKRVWGEISDDDEVEHMQSQRIKRPRGGKSLPGTQLPTSTSIEKSQPKPSGEQNRQDGLVHTPRHPARPIGSAVERLHHDRARRPAPKATVGQIENLKSVHYPQPNATMGDTDYTIYNLRTDSEQPQERPQPGDRVGHGRVYIHAQHSQPGLEPYQSRPESSNGFTHVRDSAPQPSSHRQRGPANERTRTLQDAANAAPCQAPNSPPQVQESRNSGTRSDPIDLAREETHRPPRRANSPRTPRYVQDDPFFSDDLFNGMVTGQPNNNHVGSIYTRSQQREHDEHYQRLMTPHATNNQSQHPMPPPPRPFRVDQPPSAFVSNLQDPCRNPDPQPHIPYNIPLAPAQDATLALPAQQSNDNNDLDFGAICDWNEDWRAFAIEHDPGPLLRGHFRG